MDQHAVAALQVGRILLELKRERLRIRHDSRAADRAEILDPNFQPAVVQQIRQILVRRHRSRCTSRVNRRKYSSSGVGTAPGRSPKISDASLHRVPGPGRAVAANLFIEAFVSQVRYRRRCVRTHNASRSVCCAHRAPGKNPSSPASGANEPSVEDKQPAGDLDVLAVIALPSPDQVRKQQSVDE